MKQCRKWCANHQLILPRREKTSTNFQRWGIKVNKTFTRLETISVFNLGINYVLSHTVSASSYFKQDGVHSAEISLFGVANIFNLVFQLNHFPLTEKWALNLKAYFNHDFDTFFIDLKRSTRWGKLYNHIVLEYIVLHCPSKNQCDNFTIHIWYSKRTIRTLL